MVPACSAGACTRSGSLKEAQLVLWIRGFWRNAHQEDSHTEGRKQEEPRRELTRKWSHIKRTGATLLLRQVLIKRPPLLLVPLRKLVTTWLVFFTNSSQGKGWLPAAHGLPSLPQLSTPGQDTDTRPGTLCLIQAPKVHISRKRQEGDHLLPEGLRL